MIKQSDILKLESKYRVKTKSQKDSYRELLANVKKISDALQSAVDGMKYISKIGVTFTRRQRWMIYCLSDRGIFGTIKKWLLQKIILKTIKESR
jgi:long-subunit acyl-CoA synthetase (AMP-forming)